MTDMESSPSFAHYKRFKEILVADPGFLPDLRQDPKGTLAAHFLSVPVALFAPHLSLPVRSWPFADIDRRVMGTDWRHEIPGVDESAIINPCFKAWFRRQQERIRGQFVKPHADLLNQVLFAFELSVGCSGGCDFCTFSAPSLEEVFRYTEKNQHLWRGILIAAREVIGPAAGFCTGYWATDPFDNPDYEKFCRDAHACFGRFPKTTTIKGQVSPPRSLEFQKMVSEKQGIPTFFGFSVTSLDMLDRIHSRFSPEELEFIGLALNNPEASTRYSNTGRIRELTGEKPGEEKIYLEGTSACLTGFLLNLPRRTIRLISPCPPSEAWPFGYLVFDSVRFSDPPDFARRLEWLIAEHMTVDRPSEQILRIRSDLELTLLEDGFELKTPHLKHTFTGDPLLRELGRSLATGSHRIADLEEKFILYTASPDFISDTVRRLFEAGLLVEPGNGATSNDD